MAGPIIPMCILLTGRIIPIVPGFTGAEFSSDGIAGPITPGFMRALLVTGSIVFPSWLPWLEEGL